MSHRSGRRITFVGFVRLLTAVTVRTVRRQRRVPVREHTFRNRVYSAMRSFITRVGVALRVQYVLCTFMREAVVAIIVYSTVDNCTTTHCGAVDIQWQEIAHWRIFAWHG